MLSLAAAAASATGSGVAWRGYYSIRVVAAPQVVYLSARLGFTLRDDGQDTITYVMKP